MNMYNPPHPDEFIHEVYLDNYVGWVIDWQFSILIKYLFSD